MARRGSLALAAVAAVLASSGGQAFAQDFHEDHEQLVEVTAPDRASATRLQIDYDVGYMMSDLKATVVATDTEIARLRTEGYRIGATVADESTVEERRAEREAAIRAEKLSNEFAEEGIPAKGVKRYGKTIVNEPGEVVIMRAYTFTNYAGTFLYVEAHSKLGTTSSQTTANLSVSTAGADGVFGTAVPFTMPIGGGDPPRYTDAGQYMYHRHLQPVDVTGADPVTVRVASDKGGVDEARSPSGSASRSRRTCPSSRRASSTATWTRRRSPSGSTAWPRSSRTSPKS